MTKPFCLDDIAIASPCPSAWEQMAGTSKVRFCGGCRKNVYNLSVMTRAEAVRTITAAEGGLCARMYRREDGTLLTADCPVGYLTRLESYVERKARESGSRMSSRALRLAGAGLLLLGAALGSITEHLVVEPWTMADSDPRTSPVARRHSTGVVTIDRYVPDPPENRAGRPSTPGTTRP